MAALVVADALTQILKVMGDPCIGILRVDEPTKGGALRGRAPLTWGNAQGFEEDGDSQ